jgi:serine phosphatase RsbU (regulator of sigma subunit)
VVSTELEPFTTAVGDSVGPSGPGGGRPLVSHRWTIIACVYFAILFVASLVATPHESFSGLYTLVPVLLALEWSPLIVILGSMPLVVLAATNTLGLSRITSEATVVRSTGVLVAIAIAAYVAAYREHHVSALSDSRAATLAAHEAILPIVPRSIGPYRFACAYRSAAQEAYVGGDFYKVIPTDFGVRLIVGDARGKGLKAIAMTAAVLGCFREWAPETTSVKQLVARLDARVVDKGTLGDFVTGILATFDEDYGVEIANCGHPSPIRFTGGAPLEGVIPERRTTPFGLAPDPTLSTIAFRPGDRLLFFTDGLIESRDRNGSWIELDQELIGTVGSDPMDGALDALLARLEERAGTLNDDVALLLVAYEPPPEDPSR